MAASDAYGSRQNRLPTLMEVLNRQTQPPVDLFSFYIYMRDQQRSVDYLDFWSDQTMSSAVIVLTSRVQA